MGSFRRILAAILLFVPSLNLLAQSSDQAVPTDPNREYRVAVSSFQGEGLSTDNEYLRQAIPKLIVQTLAALQEHQFDDVELAAYRGAVLDEAIEKQRQTIDKLFQSRSAMLFGTADLTKALESSTKSIDSAETRLSFLQGLDPKEIVVQRDKPIKLVSSSSGEQLVAYPDVSPAKTSRDLNLGILVWGSIDQVEDYLVVHVSVYDAALQKNVYDFGKTYTASSVLGSVSEVSNELVRSVLGRDFGSLALEVKPASAMVYLDGEFFGIGGTTIRYMHTGTHQLELRSPGYAAKRVEVAIQPFEVAKESIDLGAISQPEVVVRSTPAGADIYLASEWKGTTPAVLPRPSEDKAMVLRLKGYHDYTTTLGQQSPERMNIRLLPDVFDSEEYVSSLRDRFYTSFGAFALSLIIPVSSYSMMQDSLFNLQITTSPTEAERLKNQIGVWYYSFLGGAFISSALFVNTIIDISEYLQAIR